MPSGVPYMALASLMVWGSPVARSGPPSPVPSGQVASFSWRTRFCSRRSRAASRSSAASVEKRAGDPDLHRVEAAATSLHLGLVGGDVRGHARERRVLPEEQVEPVGGDLADRALAARAHPDLRMRLLRRWRFDHDVVELPVLAPMAEGLVGGPRLQQDLEALLEPRVGFLHRHAEARKLVVPIALADPEIEPAPGQEIERRGLFRQQHRVVPWQHHDSGAETQPARARSDPGQEIERGRHLTVAREVVLHDERAVKAQRLRLDVVVDEIAKSLAAVEFRTTAPRRRTAEQAESHLIVLPSGSYSCLRDTIVRRLIPSTFEEGP